MNIGENIKKVRESKKVSQEQLSKISGIPRTSLGRYERGERTPTIDMVHKIADALKVAVTELITGEKQELNTIEKDIIAFSTEELLEELYRRTIKQEDK